MSNNARHDVGTHAITIPIAIIWSSTMDSQGHLKRGFSQHLLISAKY